MQSDSRGKRRDQPRLRIREILLKDGKKEKGFLLLCPLVSAAIVLLDQATKLIAKSNFSDPVHILPFFNLVLVYNPGAAWGMFSGRGSLLLIFSAIVLILIIAFHRKLTEDWTERYLALSLVAGGIVGNSIDRILWKAVIDFLDFHIAGRHWPAFNVADSAICVGVGIFIISNLLRPPQGAKG